MNKRIVGAFLSAILPGTGQLYFHQWIKGGFFLSTAMLLSGIVRRVSIGAPVSLGESLPFLGNTLLVHGILLTLALWSAVDLLRAPQNKKGQE